MPPSPPPELFEVVNTIAVTTSHLSRVSPAIFASAVLATVSAAVATVNDEPEEESRSTIVVTITEEQELEVESGRYQLQDASGAINLAAVASFLGSIKQAVCVDMTGTCSTSLARRMRQLQGGEQVQSDKLLVDARADSLMTHRRLATRSILLTRTYDATSSNVGTDVDELIADAMGGMGVSVVSSRVTTLSAESVVTTVGKAAATTDVTSALNSQALSPALAERLPTIGLVITTSVVTPPSSPPPFPSPPPEVPPPPSTPPPVGPQSPPMPWPWERHLFITLLAVASVVLLAVIFYCAAHCFANVKVQHGINSTLALPRAETPSDDVDPALYPQGTLPSNWGRRTRKERQRALAEGAGGGVPGQDATTPAAGTFAQSRLRPIGAAPTFASHSADGGLPPTPAGAASLPQRIQSRLKLVPGSLLPSNWSRPGSRQQDNATPDGHRHRGGVVTPVEGGSSPREGGARGYLGGGFASGRLPTFSSQPNKRPPSRDAWTDPYESTPLAAELANATPSPRAPWTPRSRRASKEVQLVDSWTTMRGTMQEYATVQESKGAWGGLGGGSSNRRVITPPMTSTSDTQHVLGQLPDYTRPNSALGDVDQLSVEDVPSPSRDSSGPPAFPDGALINERLPLPDASSVAARRGNSKARARAQLGDDDEASPQLIPSPPPRGKGGPAWAAGREEELASWREGEASARPETPPWARALRERAEARWRDFEASRRRSAAPMLAARFVTAASVLPADRRPPVAPSPSTEGLHPPPEKPGEEVDDDEKAAREEKRRANAALVAKAAMERKVASEKAKQKAEEERAAAKRRTAEKAAAEKKKADAEAAVAAALAGAPPGARQAALQAAKAKAEVEEETKAKLNAEYTLTISQISAANVPDADKM